LASVLKVDKLDPQSGTALELGTSGDTITVPSGVGLTLTSSTLLLPTTINTDKIDPKSGTALELGSSGDTVSLPSGATLDISASTLTPPATMPASSGVNLTALNATELTSGTVPAARLSGVGKIGQVLQGIAASTVTVNSEVYTQVSGSVAITPVATDSKVLVMFFGGMVQEGQLQKSGVMQVFRDTTGLGNLQGHLGYSYTVSSYNDKTEYSWPSITALDSPSSTSELTYTVQAKMSQATGQHVWNYALQNGTRSFMIVMEVLA